MKKIKLYTLVGLSVLLLSSCAKIFYSPDAFTLAHSHKTIAIRPPSVSIAASKKTDAEVIKEQQITDKKLIWNYDHKFSGGLGSSSSRLVDGSMRKASKCRT